MLAYYRNFIYFIIVLGLLGYSHLAAANVTIEPASDNTEASTPSSSNETVTNAQVQEMSATTGDTFEMPNYRLEFTGLFGFADINNRLSAPLQWNFSADILYRIKQYDRWTSSLGLRYRTFFNSSSDNSSASGSIDYGEISVHQITLLSQNLIFIESEFLSIKLKSFAGFFIGLHIWKSLNSGNDSITSSQFLWSWLSYQFGIKSGIMLSSHLAFTTEIGFDQLAFNEYQRSGADGTRQEDHLQLSNIYVTLGISYFL